MNKYDFFLCYTRNDYAVVRLFQIELEKHGANCFDVKSLESGDFAEQITTAIRNSKAMLVFCSANAENSRWVHNEYRYALKLNIPVIPIWTEGKNLISGILASDLACMNGYDYSTLSLQDIITQLCRHFQINKAQTNDLPHDIVDSFEDVASRTNQPFRRPAAQPKVLCSAPNTAVAALSMKKIKIGCLLCIIVLLIVGIIVAIGSVRSVPRVSDRGNQSIKTAQYAPSFKGRAYSAFDSDASAINFKSLVFTTITLIVVLIITTIIIYCCKNRSLSIRFYNKKKNGTVYIYVDGVYKTTINAGETKSVTNKKGEYAIRIQSKELEDKYIEFIQPFNKQENKKIVNIHLDDQQRDDIKQNKSLKTYRCFIGGSTSIVHERNAARAVLSILYNEWDKYDFKITAHTYEDFAQKHKKGGNQMEYDEFIKQKADCTIFIICKYVGDKTLGEYQIAVDTCEKTENQRPAVFVYNDISCEGDDSVIKFKELVKTNNAYWNDYQDLTQLMLKLQNDLNAELTRLLLMCSASSSSASTSGNGHPNQSKSILGRCQYTSNRIE